MNAPAEREDAMPPIDQQEIADQVFRAIAGYVQRELARRDAVIQQLETRVAALSVDVTVVATPPRLGDVLIERNEQGFITALRTYSEDSPPAA